MPIHDDHWPGMSTQERRLSAARAEGRRVGDSAMLLRRIAGRVQYEDKTLSDILYAASAVAESGGRGLAELRGELPRNLASLADAIERAAAARAPVDEGEPLPP